MTKMGVSVSFRGSVTTEESIGFMFPGFSPRIAWQAALRMTSKMQSGFFAALRMTNNIFSHQNQKM